MFCQFDSRDATLRFTQTSCQVLRRHNIEKDTSLGASVENDRGIQNFGEKILKYV
ncbi:hypothetical protein LEP1GSC038_0165 [Leptospira weilii str. 2006001855]|uniref:Uncharacterized protein n=1 Tax=Leptospira weilii str. 2006001855 TaxID=996804 RepID=M6FVH3_9LEPT|nr:hypothetical protein LEP1GSC038_0165 [Leptospira weilii str. 2006001855]